jgi:hypothetical protein
MAQYRDYIPKTDADVIVFAKNLYDYALANCERWSVASPKDMLETQITAFETALVAFNNPNHGKVDTANKNTAKDALVHALRTYIQGFVARNPKVSDGDKEKMSLPLRDTTPTASPRPTTQPGIVVENTRNRFEHLVKALNRETGSMAKPEDAYGVHYGWQVGGEKPASAEDLPKGKFSRKTNLTVTYTEADNGKPAYYAACYENSKGEAGPWSPIEEAFVG